MGSSTKKKNEKRKDFAKPKLKVGKARPKSNNFTDTSFKSKGQAFLEVQFKPEITDSDRSHCSCPPIPYYRCSYSIHAILPPSIASVLPLIISAPRLSYLSHYINHLPPRQYTHPTACQRPLAETQPSDIGR